MSDQGIQRTPTQQSLNMPAPSSWRSLASGAASKARDYLSSSRAAAGTTSEQSDRQTWEQWARQKISRGKSVDDALSAGVEQVSMFPGWATRQYLATSKPSQDEVPEFKLEVSVSGYATSLRPPEFASRSERALMRIARGFAALPKLTNPPSSSSSPDSPRLLAADARTSTDSARPGERLALLTDEPAEDASTASPYSRSGSPEPLDLPIVPPVSREESATFLDMHNVALLHSNLDSRLRPFWARPLANRLVRLSLYLQQRDESEEPLYVQDVLTSAQGGAFNVRFSVPFERLCTHPRGVHLAFGGMQPQDHAILVHAHLLPPPPRPQSSVDDEKPLPAPPPARIESEMTVPLGGIGVRVISDIDDTVKNSEVLGGIRTVFRNVFVRPLEQVVIQSMSDWYQAMYHRGVKFHYVSNGPFELLSVLKEFLTTAALPPGSVRLKYYQTKSMFNWMSWEPAGERKRAGLIELLDAFPTSKFILIGDTGEHDLEVYSSLAADRPGQIVAIYVRDVSTRGTSPLSDPAPAPQQTLNGPLNAAQLHLFRSTGDLHTTAVPGGPAPLTAATQLQPSKGMFIGAANVHRPPQKTLTDPEWLAATRSAPATPPLYTQLERSTSSSPSPQPLSRAGTQDFPGALVMSPTPTAAALTPAEKRRVELQARLDRAREIVPRHIVLRAFREPEECVETWEILERAEHETAAQS
ncbi:hypothetical protein BKA62DRAFT_688738 [Auriculariales sp. MPI-PUGE-AT-0066]|nr:hypothetical protein BKA62DRAFT_688738 [Auriculariales sp. MPI-PUGE-AT-0066]